MLGPFDRQGTVPPVLSTRFSETNQRLEDLERRMTYLTITSVLYRDPYRRAGRQMQ
jgi:hypothetical protein